MICMGLEKTKCIFFINLTPKFNGKNYRKRNETRKFFGVADERVPCHVRSLSISCIDQEESNHTFCIY